MTRKAVSDFGIFINTFYLINALNYYNEKVVFADEDDDESCIEDPGGACAGHQR